jgi:hypothetical protein
MDVSSFNLTSSELESLRECLMLPITASDEAVMREFARNYWWNHGNGMKDGDPLDMVCLVPTEKLEEIARHYEHDYRGIRDRRP